METTIFLGGEKDGRSPFENRMFDNASFKLFIDLELLEFLSVWTCSVWSRFERASSKNDFDWVLGTFYVSK